MTGENGRYRRERREAARALGGEHNAIRAEQLRALGRGDRYIARVLGVDRGAIANWFSLQNELVNSFGGTA